MSAAEDHKCMHEKEITLLVANTDDMARDLHSLIDSIKGNGKPGLLTTIALQKQSISKLHERVDEIAGHLETAMERAAICDANEKAINRLWKIIFYVGGPTLLTILVSVVKHFIMGE